MLRCHFENRKNTAKQNIYTIDTKETHRFEKLCLLIGLSYSFSDCRFFSTLHLNMFVISLLITPCWEIRLIWLLQSSILLCNHLITLFILHVHLISSLLIWSNKVLPLIVLKILISLLFQNYVTSRSCSNYRFIFVLLFPFWMFIRLVVAIFSLTTSSSSTIVTLGKLIPNYFNSSSIALF